MKVHIKKVSRKRIIKIWKSGVMETKRALLTQRMRTLASNVVSLCKTSEIMSMEDALDEFKVHCDDVAGEQGSKFDRDRVEQMAEKISDQFSSIKIWVIGFIACLGVMGMLLFMVWSIPNETPAHKEIIRDVKAMRSLWLYQLKVDSMILWQRGLGPNLQPIDTTGMNESTIPFDWSRETLRAIGY